MLKSNVKNMMKSKEEQNMVLKKLSLEFDDPLCCVPIKMEISLIIFNQESPKIYSIYSMQAMIGWLDVGRL